MAHVHGEYLEEVDDQENIQMEMIVETEDQNIEIQDISNLAKSVDDNNKNTKEDRENSRSVRHNAKNEKRSMVKLLVLMLKWQRYNLFRHIFCYIFFFSSSFSFSSLLIYIF